MTKNNELYLKWCGKFAMVIGCIFAALVELGGIFGSIGAQNVGVFFAATILAVGIALYSCFVRAIIDVFANISISLQEINNKILVKD